MKKILLILITLIFSFFNSFNIVKANTYPIYLWGNKNFILCGAHQGYAQYIDKNSLSVDEYKPPIYKLSICVLEVPNADRGNITPNKTYIQHFYYDWNQRKMYSLWSDRQWHYIYPVGSMAKTGHFFAGEMAFYLAYKIKFYGGREWLDEETNTLQNPHWSNELYESIDNAR